MSLNKATHEKKSQKINMKEIAFYSKLIHHLKAGVGVNFSGDKSIEKIIDLKSKSMFENAINDDYKIENLEECKMMIKQKYEGPIKAKMVKKVREIEMNKVLDNREAKLSFFQPNPLSE